MAFEDIIYAVDGPIGVITLNRPAYRNAQGYRMLDEIDQAFALARADAAVRVVIVRGAGGVFSTGHDLGTPDGMAYRAGLGAKPGIETYDQFKRYNLDLLLAWRNFPKPTVAMVEGYWIYAVWMLAAAMDVVFAAETAEFLGGFVEYNSIPWDIGVRKAKELCFESRFISAAEARDLGLVNRVLPIADLERETWAWARRVAENSPEALRFAKIQMNKAQDAQGFTAAVEDSLGDYQAMMHLPGNPMRMEGQRRLLTVDLAVKEPKRRRPLRPDARRPANGRENPWRSWRRPSAGPAVGTSAYRVRLRDPGVMLVTFNRPDKLNALTQAMKRDLIELITAAQMDDAVRVVVFAGAGRAFCAGDDMGGYQTAQSETVATIHGDHKTPIGTANALRGYSQALNVAVRSLDKITIAAINGPAIQTGLSLALSCDFRIGSTKARLGSATLRFALLPDEGGHALLVQHLGLAGALDFILRKKIVNADQALALGLLTEVVEPDRLLPRALELANEMAEGPQVAMRLLKRAIYNAAELTFAQALEDIAVRTGITDHHADARDGGALVREARAEVPTYLARRARSDAQHPPTASGLTSGCHVADAGLGAGVQKAGDVSVTDFDDVVNFRDFGGAPGADGRRVRRGQLYRSGHHAAASEADLERLAALNLALLVDLRRPGERERDPARRPADLPTPRCWSTTARWRWPSPRRTWRFIAHDPNATTDEHVSAHSMQVGYRGYPFDPHYVKLWRDYFDRLAKIDGPVLINCHAGKDRTGVLCALTLHTLGVGREDIYDDYLETNRQNRADARLAQMSEQFAQNYGRPPSEAFLRFMMAVDPIYLDAAFAEIESAHGDVDTYLADILGVDDETRAAIRARLLVWPAYSTSDPRSSHPASWAGRAGRPA